MPYPTSPHASAELRTLVARLAQDLGVDVCSLYKLDPTGTQLTLVATHGLSQSSVGYRMPISLGLTGRVARIKKVVAVKDPMSHPDYHHVVGSGEERYKTFLGIPIHGKEGLLGVLVVQTIEPHLFLLQEIAQIHATGRDVEPWLRAA